MTRREWRVATAEGRWQIVGSRVRGESRPDSDWDMLTCLTPEEAAAWKAGHGFPEDVVRKFNEFRYRKRKGQLFVAVEEPHPRVPEQTEVSLYQIIGPKRGKYIHAKAVPLAAGLPKEQLPRPEYSIAPEGTKWIVTLFSNHGGRLFEPVPGEVFDTAAEALDRARHLGTQAPGPRYLDEPGWTPQAAADFGHRCLVEKALAQGKQVPAAVLAEYPDPVR
jgi:hypothetical protein